jgi:hypothetical protein
MGKERPAGTIRNMPKRVFRDLNTDEIARLCVLNDKLIGAEKWIHQRQQQCLSAYYAAGGVKNHRFSDDLIEDVEVEATVGCLLRENHPGYNPDDDNIVAKLDAALLFREPWDEGFSFDELAGGASIPHLANVKLCWLFHDLLDHVLHRDWDRALSVGGLWIEVKLIQQRIASW